VFVGRNRKGEGGMEVANPGGESYQSRSSKGKVELDGLGGIETNYSSAGEGGDDWSAGTIWD